MRRYETIIIINPDTSADDRGVILEKITTLITKHTGFLVSTDEWGDKNLAYQIKKKTRGYYILFDYCGAGELVTALERAFKFDERVLKYMTVLLGKDIDLDSIKEEISKKEAEAAELEKETSDDSKTEEIIAKAPKSEHDNKE